MPAGNAGEEHAHAPGLAGWHGPQLDLRGLARRPKPVDDANRNARSAWPHEVGAENTLPAAPMPTHGPRSAPTGSGAGNALTIA